MSEFRFRADGRHFVGADCLSLYRAKSFSNWCEMLEFRGTDGRTVAKRMMNRQSRLRVEESYERVV